MIKKLLLILFIFFCTNLWNQEPSLYHKEFSKQDGLKLDTIETMVFDDDGFLWLGGSSLQNREIIDTKNSSVFQRFDGKLFHTIVLPAMENEILEISHLKKRNDGQLFIKGSFKNKGHFILLFNPITFEFKRIKFLENQSTVIQLAPIVFYEDEAFALYQKDRNLVFGKIKKDLTFQSIFDYTYNETEFSLNGSTTVLPFKNTILIGGDHFPIHFFDWNGRVLKKESAAIFNRKTGVNANKRYITNVFHFDKITYVKMHNNLSIYKIDAENTSITLVNSRENKFPSNTTKIIKDTYGKQIIVNYKNDKILLSSFNEKEELQLFSEIQSFTSSPFTVTSDNIFNEFWIADQSAKLHYYKTTSNKVQTFLSDFSIRKIKPLGNKKYLVATEKNGWFTVSLLNKSVKPYFVYENDLEIKLFSSRNIFFEGNTIWSNTSSSIVAIDTSTHNIKSYRHFPVISMVNATDSTLVYGTKGYALVEFNKKTKKHSVLLDTKEYDIYDIKQINETLILATNKGVITYHLTNKSHKIVNDTVLQDPFLLTVAVDPSNNQVLLGARSGKVYAYSLASNEVSLVYEDPLKAGIASFMFQDGHWWIGTFNGFVKYNPVTKASERFSDRDGFSHSEANRYSYLNTEEGLFIGTLEGLNFFKPEEFNTSTKQNKLVITKTRLYDTKAKQFVENFNREVLNNSKKISLSQENKELQIDFSVTHRIDNPNYTLMYRLNKEDWVSLEKQNTIRFPNLGAGEYQLEVKALNDTGKLLGAPLQISINSKEFFYKTWWFFLGISLLIIFISIYLLNEAREKRKIQEGFSQQLILTQERERTRIAKELHDGIGQRLTLIKRKAQKEQKDEISQLTNDTLEEVRSISRNLYPAILKQLGLTEGIEQLIYEIDENSDIFFTSEIEEIDSLFNEAESLNFYRFIQECLSNILKHAEATSVSIIIKKELKTLKLYINDNGVGFDTYEQLKNQSLGLKTLQERIKILKGVLKINSSKAKGTLIECEIPLNE